MKIKNAFICLLAAAFGTAIALAATLTFTQGPEYLWRTQSDVTFTSGTLSAAVTTSFFEQDMVPSSTASATLTNHTGQVTYDLIAKGSTTVTASGVQVTYLQLAALNAAAASQEYAAYLAAQAAAAAAASTGTTSTASGP